MSVSNKPQEPDLALPATEHLEEKCDQFEAAWKAGSQPRIEDFLAPCKGLDIGQLLRELVQIDAAYRWRLHDPRNPEDYLTRFPALDREWLSQIIETANDSSEACEGTSPSQCLQSGFSLSSVVADASPSGVKAPAFASFVESGRTIRCPYCQDPMELADDQPDEVLCPCCGSSFRVRDTRQTSTVAQMPKLGKFQVLEQLGVGAFGAVWRARDTVLDKIVALKIPHASLLQSEEDRKRFYREARTAAQLRHPGIVAVHEIADLESEAGKLPAIVSDFVDGVTLREWLAHRRPTYRESAELVAQIAEALAYAHSMGVIHRDIKPANIMLEYSCDLELPATLDCDRTGQSDSARKARPQPLVLDFGLALRDGAEATITMDGQILGTPAYMSPEQASGQSHHVDARTDVYSLGVVLYELLCGAAPFSGSRLSVLDQVLHAEPPALRRISGRIPRDIETVCLKAMAKDAKRRYQTAAEFAAELRRWLAGEAVHARPVSHAERLLRWAKRNPAIASQTAVVVVLALAGIMVAHWVNRRSQAEHLVQTILVTKPDELAKLIVTDVPHVRRWADPLLHHIADDHGADPAQRVRAAVALAPVDPQQNVYLAKRLLDCNWDEFPMIRDALHPQSSVLADDLWGALRDGDQDDDGRFRAGLALAAFVNTRGDWSEPDIAFLVDALVRSNPERHRELRAHLWPIRALLLRRLESTFHDELAREGQRHAAAAALAEFGRDDPQLLARLTCDATPDQFRLLFPQLNATSESRELARQVFRNGLREFPAISATDSDRIPVGRHRAGAAIALVRLGSHAAALDAFHVDGDPESLTQFVHGAAERGIKPRDLLQCLDLAVSSTERFALLLTLGDFKFDSVTAADREPFIEKLLEWHRSDPCSAIHSATCWLLRTWGLDERLAELDRTAVPYDPTGVREWFIERIGDDSITFVVFQPAEFTMGSPASEPVRDLDEPQHTVRITRPFALADREITFAQWLRFLDSTGYGDQSQNRIGLTLDHPAVASWPEAVLFCRWLTRDAGIPESEQCYNVSSDSPSGDEPETWSARLDRSGFRLATDAEWEYACRAGTTTAYSFGSDPKLLPRYAAFEGATSASLPVATLRPSLRGLFDMYGNVSEWCHDRYRSNFDPIEVDPMGASAPATHVFRGGAWNMHPRYCRSASRSTPTNELTVRYTGMGFRIARTVSD